MKLMLQIEMFVVALLAVPCSALTASHSGGKGQKVLKTPELASAFRSDTTLHFMRRLHSHDTMKSKAEAKAETSRSVLCMEHGFKTTERAGCVAFMRQACHDDGKISQESCVLFSAETQPGYRSSEQSKAESQGPLSGIPDDFKDLQQGPQYNSKRAQTATAKADDGTSTEVGAEEPDVPDTLQHGPQGSTKTEKDEVPDSWQQGPKHDSKNSQKETKKAADEQAKAGPREGGLDTALKPWGEAVSKAFRDAQRGPNYKKKNNASPPKAKPEPEPEEPEEPEEKEVASEPGCRNVKGWADSKDRDCEDYAEGEWCTRTGGYGDAWLDEWGTFEDAANKGKSAKQACCVCGGGIRNDEDEEKSEKKPSQTPGAAPSGAPSGAPAGAPGPAGPILGGKGAKVLQEQGYSGELVEHEDQVTMTSDWGREFGPRSGHRDIKTICVETPGNEWCSLHGYYDKEHSSASGGSHSGSTSMWWLGALAAVIAMLFLVRACLQ